MPADVKDFADKDSVKWDEINRINSTIPPNLDINIFEKQAIGTYIFADPNTELKVTYVIKDDLGVYVDDIKQYEFIEKIAGSETQAFYKSTVGETYIGVEVVKDGTLINSDPASDAKMLSLFRDTSLPTDVKDFANEATVLWLEANRINSTVPIPIDPNSFVGKAIGTYIFKDPMGFNEDITYVIKNDLNLYIGDIKIYDYVKLNGNENQAFYKRPSGETYIGVEVVRGGAIENSEPGTDKMLSLFRDTSLPTDVKDFANEATVLWLEANRINSTLPHPDSFVRKAPGTYVFADLSGNMFLQPSITYTIKSDLHIYDKNDKRIYHYKKQKDNSADRAVYVKYIDVGVGGPVGEYAASIGVEVVRGGAIENSEPGTDKMLTLFRDTTDLRNIKDFYKQVFVTFYDANRINSTTPLRPTDTESFHYNAPDIYKFEVLEEGAIATTYRIHPVSLDIYKGATEELSTDKAYKFVSNTTVASKTRAHYQSMEDGTFIGVEVVKNGVRNSLDNTKTLSLFKDKTTNPGTTTEWANIDDIDFAEGNRITAAEAPPVVRPPDWKKIGDDSTGFSAGTVTDTASVVDSVGNLYVMYGDGAPRVKKYSLGTSTWTTMNIAAAGTVLEAEITIDGSDNIYVTAKYNMAPKVWKLPAGTSTWEDITPEGLTTGNFPSITVNNAGTKLYLSYIGSKPNVKEYDTGTKVWTTIASDLASLNAWTTPIAVHPTSDELYLAKAGKQGGNWNLSIHKLSGTSWTQVGANLTLNTTQDIDLKFSPSGVLYVAYYTMILSGNNNISRGTVKKLNGATWELVGAENFMENPPSYLSMSFDSSENPIVAYSGADGSSPKWVGTTAPAEAYAFDGATWNTIGLTGKISTGDAEYTSVTVHSDGTVYVSYKDRLNDNKLSVRQFVITP